MNEQFINDLSKELAKLGTIHSVGEEWISYTGKIPSGGIPYCGQEVTRETYSALWSWVQAQGLVKTESEWQSLASSQNGNVPFYSSGNGTSTFRMPKLVGYVKGASSQVESGAYVKEGLPNITGSFSARQFSGNYSLLNEMKGAFSRTANGGDDTNSTDVHYASDTSEPNDYFSFDASRSNPIYGNSSHVTPETSTVLFGVYAFGTVSNPSDLNVSTLASDVDNIKTSYLPLTGGTMTGTIDSSASEFKISKTANGGSTVVYGGVDQTVGGVVIAYGKDNTNAGQVRVRPCNGTNNSTLVAYPDGKLQWNSREVERVNSVGTKWIRYENGIQICWGSVSGLKAKTTTTITYPVAFSKTPEPMITRYSSDSATTEINPWIKEHTPTSFGVYTVSGTGIYYLAIGWWK